MYFKVNTLLHVSFLTQNGKIQMTRQVKVECIMMNNSLNNNFLKYKRIIALIYTEQINYIDIFKN